MEKEKYETTGQSQQRVLAQQEWASSGLYDLGLGTLLAPVPVALVGTGSEEAHNFFAVAWTGVINSEPPMVSISVRRERHSYTLLCKTGRFTLHLTDETLCKDVDFCGVRSGAKLNKSAALGWEPLLISDLPPILPQAPVCLLCTVQNSHDLGSHVLFLATIDQVLVRKNCMDDKGALQLHRLGLVAYAHGVYHKLSEPIGFFGYSVASKEVYRRRMKRLRTEKQKGQASRQNDSYHRARIDSHRNNKQTGNSQKQRKRSGRSRKHRPR